MEESLTTVATIVVVTTLIVTGTVLFLYFLPYSLLLLILSSFAWLGYQLWFRK